MFTAHGLSDQEVQKGQLQYGKNILPEKSPPGIFTLFIAQLTNPLIYVLLIAGALTIFIGDLSDAAIIFLSVAINTVLGFVQERKATNALFALKHYVSNKTTVFRNGKRVSIDTSELVPGDIVQLSQGAKIPADGVFTWANRLFVNESILTGESAPIKKREKEEVFMGTTVATGQAFMSVTTIGAKTKMGAIALQIQEGDGTTPLQRQLKDFSKQLIYVVLILVSLVVIAGLLRGFSLTDIFITSVALAVSSIPEGLIVALTVVLAIGMQKILKRKGLVRKLSAAETLGGVTVICVDKTGTLTEGKMEVVEVVGDKESLARQVLIANDMDDPIVIAAYEWGKKIIPGFISENPRIDSIPFSSEARCFVSLNKASKTKNIMYVNGAPDEMLKWCDLSQKEKKAIFAKIDELTNEGKRIIGLACKEVSAHKQRLDNDDHKDGLVWEGILAFSDPIRKGVKSALDDALSAGITTIVITGDYAKTSRFVLAELGINLTAEEIATGDEIRKLSVSELSQKVRSIRLFARTTPDQKLMIVQALKKNGEVVSMMGDGVNDAPALHDADIGIAVGEATDVAKESADLVLLNSDFGTIIGAIEEGRTIFENIRKIILYLMSDAFSEIIVVLGSILLGLPLAVSAVQILWVNLVSDGFPNLALTIDPTRIGIMKEMPRPASERLVNRWMGVLIAIVSITAGLIALIAFIIIYKTTGDLQLARSFAFITLGLNSMSYVFSVRTLMVPFWKNKIFENKWLIIAVVAGVCLQILPFTTHITRKFFGLSALGIYYWMAAALFSVVIFFVVEAFKFIYHRSQMIRSV